MLRYAMVLVVILVASQAGAKPFENTAAKFTNNPVERQDFSALSFVSVKNSTAIFTYVNTEFGYTEKVKDQLREWLPDAHVRRVITSTSYNDQTLMVMWNPKEYFRASINDYTRVIDDLDHVVSTKTYFGTTDQYPEKYPVDTLLGWIGIDVSDALVSDNYEAFVAKISADPDVIQVARVAGVDVDLIVVYRFSGSSLPQLLSISGRLESMISGSGHIMRFNDRCP